MTKENKNGWRKCKTSDIVFPYADCFYQKCFYDFGEAKICSEIVEYTMKEGRKSWTLEVNVPNEVSITDEWIKAQSYSYNKLDFVRMEREARKMIKALVKKV